MGFNSGFKGLILACKSVDSLMQSLKMAS